jgi:hypothetical protein
MTMSPAVAARRKHNMDILFVIDATGSMQNAIDAAREKASDLAFELHINNRVANFTFGCVCYRDPVDAPSDKHEFIDLDPRVAALTVWLESIKAVGGGDEPEDYAGALEIAFSGKITWRDGRHALIWMADAPAHGTMFGGTARHNDQAPRLCGLVARMAHEKYYVSAIDLSGWATRTYQEMKKIYDAHGGPSFVIDTMHLETEDEIKRIQDTMLRSCQGAASAMMKSPERKCTVPECPRGGT